MQSINGKTRIASVLGHPIIHTASPAIHNAAFDKLHLNWKYIALDVDPRELKKTLHGLCLAGFVGTNLTVPHKIVALKCVDQIDRLASHLGAINTVSFALVKGQPFLRGYNTDGYGLLKALQESFSFKPKGKTIAIVGCGGAGRGIAIQLAIAGARRLVLLNRTRSKAAEIARRIKQLRLKTICVFSPEKCDLAIQATSLGLKPSDPLPISLKDLQTLNPRYFYETNYRPAETKMLRLVRKNKIRGANGLSMLLHQGARAFEIWTGLKAPVKVMRQALMREVYGK
jgi:shikimate dehydrogenase